MRKKGLLEVKGGNMGEGVRVRLGRLRGEWERSWGMGERERGGMKREGERGGERERDFCNTLVKIEGQSIPQGGRKEGKRGRERGKN